MPYAVDGLLGVQLDVTSTDQKYVLGTKCKGSDGAVYEYIQANGSIVQYGAVKIDYDFQSEELTTTVSGAEPTRVGFAQVAFADNEYGFVVIEGPCTILVLSSCAADVKLYTTGTDGALDDSATDLVVGAKINTLNGASTAGVAGFIAAGGAYTN